MARKSLAMRRVVMKMFLAPSDMRGVGLIRNHDGPGLSFTHDATASKREKKQSRNEPDIASLKRSENCTYGQIFEIVRGKIKTGAKA